MQALARASLDEVNEAWAGLGYYRRARFLLEGAQTIAAGPGAAMPRTAKAWLKIPGRCSFFHMIDLRDVPVSVHLPWHLSWQ